jgi:hypothetical protein
MARSTRSSFSSRRSEGSASASAEGARIARHVARALLGADVSNSGAGPSHRSRVFKHSLHDYQGYVGDSKCQRERLRFGPRDCWRVTLDVCGCRSWKEQKNSGVSVWSRWSCFVRKPSK